jgi:hypothetical protein
MALTIKTEGWDMAIRVDAMREVYSLRDPLYYARAGRAEKNGCDV